MRWLALCVVFASLLLLAGAPAGVAAGLATDGSVETDPSIAGDDRSSAAEIADVSASDPGRIADFDASAWMIFDVDLRSTREADWTVTVRYVLADANETAAFERVAGGFEAGDVGPSADLYRNLAAGASEAAGREMEIVDVGRETALDRGVDPDDLSHPDTVENVEGETVAVGELRLSFTWTGFLREDGEQLVLDDALRTSDGGTWIRSLDANQRLVIHPPDGYQADSFPGIGLSLEDRAVVIEGPRTFGPDDRIEVVYSPAPGSITGPPWLLLAGAIVLAAAVIAVGLVRYRRHDGASPVSDESTDAGESAGATASETDADTANDSDPSAGSRGTDSAGGTDVGDVGEVGLSDEELGPDAEGGSADASGSSAGSESDDGSGSSAGSESDDGSGSSAATRSTPDPSLLSDEERVEALLDRNGGRMRQADIVEETGWSDAKVSQLLSAMAEADRIEKLRLGRENLISLPDHAPTDGDEE
ncbi:helix-turn-helix transcriptional regulator [Halopenitus persicus]|uniref:helix-turn-helix transcriptional regulator n=1 Tax=Halopenitus persicus TaxID=1048396 RepID=UPI001E413461|nr:hypothetical protein [Halopenitus persicus]